MKRMTTAIASVLLCFLTACQGKGEEPVSGGTGTPSSSAVTMQTTFSVTTATSATELATTSRGSSGIQSTFGKSSSSAGSRTTTTTTTQTTTTTLPRTVTVTIPEGTTLAKAFLILEQKGVASFDDLLHTAQTYDFTADYPLVAAIPDDPNRCYKLEGYLFPDTYQFYLGDKPEDAIGRMLRGSKANFTAAMRQKAESLGFTFDEIVIIASLIEKEGASPAQANKIAAVLENRLKKKMPLQLNASIAYLEGAVNGFVIDKNAEPEKWNAWCDANNTYKCAGLPATPVCNPGTAAVNAALNPADISSLFFCANRRTGEYLYADTYAEHCENLEKIGVGDNGNFQE